MGSAAILLHTANFAYYFLGVPIYNKISRQIVHKMLLMPIIVVSAAWYQE